MTLSFEEYIEKLQQVGPETQIEPVFQVIQEKDVSRIREQTDLEQGAVRKAVTQEGSGPIPKDGDLVVFHWSVQYEQASEPVLSTRLNEGGSGHPAVAVLGSGDRCPRGVELLLQSMCVGEEALSKVAADYHFNHEQSTWPIPTTIDTSKDLTFKISLLYVQPVTMCHIHVVSEEQQSDLISKGYVREPRGERGQGGGVHGYSARDMEVTYNLIQVSASTGSAQGNDSEGQSDGEVDWERPTEPSEVTFSYTISQINGDSGSIVGGLELGSSNDQAIAKEAQMTIPLGPGNAPLGIQQCLEQLTVGSCGTFIVPVWTLRADVDKDSAHWHGTWPTFEEQLQFVVVQTRLHSMVQVRYLTSGKDLVKRRIKQGSGAYLLGMALEDSQVTLHYRIAYHDSKQEKVDVEEVEWVFDSRNEKPDGVVVITGSGQLPDALEKCVRVMTKDEVATVSAPPHYAYDTFKPAPTGVDIHQHLLFEIQVVDIQKQFQPYLQSFDEAMGACNALKQQGNDLVAAGKERLARDKYLRAIKIMERWSAYVDDEQSSKIACDLLVSLMSNMTLTCMHLAEYEECVQWSGKGLEISPNNIKLWYRQGRALSLQGNHDEADEALNLAKEQARAASDAAMEQEIVLELSSNAKRRIAAAEKQRSQLRNFFDRKT